MSIIVKIAIGLLAAFAVSSPSFAQLTESKSVPNYRITISSGLTLQNHFDGNKTIEWYQINRVGRGSYNYGWLNGVVNDLADMLNAGAVLQAEVELNQNVALVNSLQGIYTFHTEECSRCGSTGDILSRSNLLMQSSVQKSILDLNRSTIKIRFGAVYRHGWESAIINYGLFDVHLLTRSLKDFGLITGLSLDRDIANEKLRLSVAAIYSEFIYRYDIGQRSNYGWDNGSTRRMVSCFFSVGYRFGRINDKPTE